MPEAPVPPLCRVCARLHHGKPSCDAFPEGIPPAIRAGERHIDLIPGDRGLAFRKISGVPSLFIAGIRPETLFRVTVAGSYERYVPILDLWELDNEFIRYILAAKLPVREIGEAEMDALIERNRECLDAMNPCMREVRRMMYVMGRKHEQP